MYPLYIDDELPFYEFESADGEQSDPLTLLLYRAPMVVKTINERYKKITVVDSNGRICAAELTDSRIVTVQECCTEGPTNFVAGHYRLKDGNCSTADPYTLIVPRNVSSLRVINPQNKAPLTDLSKWASEEFQTPKFYLWQFDGDEPVQFRWYDENGKGADNPRLEMIEKTMLRGSSVMLKSCLSFWAHDATRIIECRRPPGDLTPSNGASPLNWIFGYQEGKLIFVIPVDHGGDDYERPFRSTTEDLVAAYRVGTTVFYAFRPGYVVSNRGGEWSREFRVPLRQYGECDCG